MQTIAGQCSLVFTIVTTVSERGLTPTVTLTELFCEASRHRMRTFSERVDTTLTLRDKKTQVSFHNLRKHADNFFLAPRLFFLQHKPNFK